MTTWAWVVGAALAAEPSVEDGGSRRLLDPARTVHLGVGLASAGAVSAAAGWFLIANDDDDTVELALLVGGSAAVVGGAHVVAGPYLRRGRWGYATPVFFADAVLVAGGVGSLVAAANRDDFGAVIGVGLTALAAYVPLTVQLIVSESALTTLAHHDLTVRVLPRRDGWTLSVSARF